MLDGSLCHFRGVWTILSLLFFFLWKILLANNVDPDQMPHVASNLGLHFALTLFRGFLVRTGKDTLPKDITPT